MGECIYSHELRKLEAISDSLQLTPPCTAKAATPGDSSHNCESRKRTPRKVKQPHKTPARSGDSSGSVVLQFQLVSGTPTPSLRIQASSNHRYALKARRRLFSKWSEVQTECKTSQLIGASDSASETSEEPDHQDIAPNSPTDEIRPKQCKTVCKVKVCASCKTKKTPLWRDAEDGTPYCNACGIRFKKYRICCPICSYIPRKDEKFGNSCCQCGSKLFHYNKLR